MKGGTRFTSGRREGKEEQYTRSIVADENRNPQRASSIVRAGVVIDGTEKGSRYVPFSLFFFCVSFVKKHSSRRNNIYLILTATEMAEHETE